MADRKRYRKTFGKIKTERKTKIMKNLWKRRAAVLGVAVLVASQSYFVLAEEHPEQEEILLQVEETVVVETEAVAHDVSDEEEVSIVEAESKETKAVSVEIKSGELQKAINLQWNGNTGVGTFTNPNSITVGWFADLYKDGEHCGGYSDGTSIASGATGEIHLFNLFDGPGTYKFTVTLVTNNSGVCTSDYSPDFEYGQTGRQLPTPQVSLVEEGKIKAEVSGDADLLAYFYEFTYQVIRSDGKMEYWGGNPDNQSFIQTIDFNVLIANGDIAIEPGYEYSARVQAMSNNLSECASSYWSDYIKIAESSSQTGGAGSSSGSSASGSSSSMTAAASKAWQPATPDEIKRYAAFGTEKVDYTTDEANEYRVTIYNAMQGGLCYDSFEAVLGDYVIGRTYNIFPSDKIVYQMDSKARITLNIPKALQADNRTFQMICVTANGQPVILKDLDSNPETITFETNTYYAFALTYKDIR